MKKSTQIKMIRGALASRKTPKVFLPSLRKRLAKLTAAVAIIFVLCGCVVRPAAAQTPVIIQPTQEPTLATNVSCTGGLQSFPVKNRNQTQHFVSTVITGSLTTFQEVIVGVVGTTVFPLSDAMLSTTPGTPTILTGSGYYPIVRIDITCTGSGTFSLNYSGASSTALLNSGGYQVAQLDKVIANSAAGGTSKAYSFQPPVGSASGILMFTYTGAGPGGSTLTLICQNLGTLNSHTETFVLATTAALIQTFVTSPYPCINEQITYTAGGASASTYSMEQLFSYPGLANLTQGHYTHITGTTATAVKATSGTFLGVNVNTSAAGTVSVFDLATAACTGTPSTNTVAVLTVNATDPPHATPFNVDMMNGICVKASVAMDLTVESQ